MNLELSYFSAFLYERITFDMFLKFIIIYFFIIWISILIWVIKDIINRTNNIILQIISILSILLLTPFGIFIYLLIRPSKTLFEKYYEEIDENLNIFKDIVEEKNKQYKNTNNCFNCDLLISNKFSFCPKCKVNLKKECKGCNKKLSFDWKICPYCGKKSK